MADAAGRRDSILTLMAVGVLAYVGETPGHEALGHGGACLATGGGITALAPLWMRCSVQTPVMVLAGPGWNAVAALVFAAWVAGRSRLGATGLFLWLSCAFNALVACGYLLVGATAGFGDWPALLGQAQPAWAWRLAAGAAGLAGYGLSLRALAGLYARMAGPERLRWRTVLPSAAAAAVALAAEVLAGRGQAATIALVLGCTLFVGWTLSVTGAKRASATQDAPIPLHPGWVIAGVATSAAFIFWIGPVSRFGG